MSQTPSTAPFMISKERRLNMPAALLVSLLAIVAAGAIAWSSTREQVQRNTLDIGEIKLEMRANREVLIRIDENVKDLRRTGRRDP